MAICLEAYFKISVRLAKCYKKRSKFSAGTVARALRNSILSKTEVGKYKPKRTISTYKKRKSVSCQCKWFIADTGGFTVYQVCYLRILKFKTNPLSRQHTRTASQNATTHISQNTNVCVKLLHVRIVTPIQYLVIITSCLANW